ncbi:MAG: hypothetical protein ABIP81_07270 [Terriglobales bacterium]
MTIDNYDGAGAIDYTSWLEANSLKITRLLNADERLECALVCQSGDLTPPAIGGRVIVAREDGHKLFTGYLTATPRVEHMGWQQAATVQRYRLAAEGDDALLQRKRMPQRPPFLQRTSGGILRQMTSDCGGGFDTTAVQDVEVLPQCPTSQQLSWREHARRLAQRSRCVVRVSDGGISFGPLGSASHEINETDSSYSEKNLTVARLHHLRNDLIVLGRYQPRAYVKDYFIGDGLSLRYSLSQSPFNRSSSTLLEEEFRGVALDPINWVTQNPGPAFSVSGGRLNLNGGPVSDGGAYVKAAELIEMGGALNLQHGEVEFTATSDGVVGGLYNGAILRANCVAGFRIAISGGSSTIRALINGAETGATITTMGGRRYALATRIYATEPYRRQQVFHSSASPAGVGLGGEAVATSARFVLEVHEIDPANPGSLGAASVVIFDGPLTDVPSHCTYGIANAGSLHGNIRFVRLLRLVGVEVRSTIPGQSPRTRLVGSLAEGAECVVTQSPDLIFFSPFVPVPNETIVARYRSTGRAMARTIDAASVAEHAGLNDDGVRTAILRIVEPAARNSQDCETAATALLQDTTKPAWQGSYECWSDFLPSGPASDPLPGESVAISAPTRDAEFTATIRAVEIDVHDLLDDRSVYRLKFANDAADPLTFEFEKGIVWEPLENVIPGAEYLADLPNAEITGITSTTITVDCGAAPPTGGGIEVRRTDFAWGPENDRNLIGRFTAQVLTLPRLARIQTYCLRPYDGSSDRKYSRNSTALHVDYPF